MAKDNQNVYDVAVVGAGPAGTVFARELALFCPDYKAVIINGQSKESAKPCGGLLAPDAQKLLARFDLALPKSVLEDPQIFAVETIDVEQKLVRYYQRHYLNMDRFAFDEWLLSLVLPSVDVCKGRCVEIKEIDGLYNIRIKQNGEEKVIKSKIVVGADGGGSIVRRTFFKPMKVQYVAMQQWF